uniref:Uncharacterized protein n=1 Tax=Pithovirus LCDPAC01 TaxID=2506600 RepID=A0A4D5XEM6_9VIRU|nr:MAG: hypothetical protein LCDPAC01_02690 [Pithovirus LCDPAC01]
MIKHFDPSVTTGEKRFIKVILPTWEMKIPEKIPKDLSDLFPSAFYTANEEPIRLSDAKHTKKEIRSSIDFLYSLNSNKTTNVKLPYAVSSTDDLSVFHRSIYQNIRQYSIPDYSDDSTYLLSQKFRIEHHIIVEDVYLYPFTSMGVIKNIDTVLDKREVYTRLKDPTGGMLTPYHLWFYVTRGYLRPLSENQIRLCMLRKKLPVSLRKALNDYIFDPYLDSKKVRSLEDFFSLHNTAIKAMVKVGAISLNWVCHSKEYMETKYTKIQLPQLNNKRCFYRAALTWKDEDLATIISGDFPDPKMYVTRDAMIGTFVSDLLTYANHEIPEFQRVYNENEEC